ncbi:hypothetical protein [Cryptosporangium aurantiacum]|uniref:hypothetical protein n=1 Tax=Cryptosporangium aurantiacum TaxID=134849 RepID=UPI00116118B5|nr:hypothetical protein [Cryptosporangium aurantiacum]
MTTLLTYWTPPRFSAAASPLIGEAVTALCSTSAAGVDGVEPGSSVADQLHVVAQVLADLGADAEGRPRRPLPPLTEPAVLADQFTVLGHDLLAAGVVAEALDRLTDRLDALRAAL